MPDCVVGRKSGLKQNRNIHCNGFNRIYWRYTLGSATHPADLENVSLQIGQRDLLCLLVFESLRITVHVCVRCVR